MSTPRRMHWPGGGARHRVPHDVPHPHRIRENIEISPLPDDALQEMRDNIATNVRFNEVVETGVSGFVPRRA